MRLLLLFQHRQVGGCAGRFLLAERKFLLGCREIRRCGIEQLLVAVKFFLKRSESSLSLGQLGFRGCRARDQFRAALFVGSNARLPTIAFD